MTKAYSRSGRGKIVVLRIILAASFAVMALLCLAACGASQEMSSRGETSASSQPQDSSQQTTSAGRSGASSAQGKVLVVCFSETGNTQAVAQEAASALGADYFQIEPVDPYTPEDLNYNDSTKRATTEQNSITARPAIANAVENMADYDTIVLCHPIWWGKAPRIMCTFLESYDFSGKTLVELCTSGSSGIEDAQAELEQICPQAKWIAGRRFAAGATQSEVASWLSSIGLIGTASQGESSAAENVRIEVRGRAFNATLADTQAARDFASGLPMTLDMDEFGGNEKSCYVDSALSTSGASIVNPIKAGDLMLYQDNCIVLFYGTHDNTDYSYVPLATIDDAAGLVDALGIGSVTVTFSTS